MAKPKQKLPDLTQVLAGLPLTAIQPIADFFAVSVDSVAAIVGIARVTLHRRRANGDRLSVDESDRVASITKIIILARETFESSDDVVRLWFSMPHPALDGKKPIDHLHTETGRRLVERALIGDLQPTFDRRSASKPKRAKPRARTLRVFLCHGKEDKEDVRRLYEDLKRDGMEPWFDEEDLWPGTEWEPIIRAAVRDSDVVLVCLSPTSCSKTGFVQKEIRIALDAAEERPEGAVYIIPVLLQRCTLPTRLARWQAVNLFDTGGYARLVWGLETRLHDLRAAPNPSLSLFSPFPDLVGR